MTAVTFDTGAPFQFVLTNGNLTGDTTPSGQSVSDFTTATPISTGQRYCEYTINSLPAGDAIFGIVNSSFAAAVNEYPGRTGSTGYGITSGGLLVRNGAGVHNFGVTYAAGDIISVLVDIGAGTITFWKNGTPTGSTYSSVAADSYIPAVGLANSKVTANFGGSAFTYTPTTGFTGWDTPPPTPGHGAITLEALTMSGARIAAGAITLEALAAVGGHNGLGALTFEAMTVVGTGGTKSGAITLEALTAAGTGGHAAYGVMVFEPLTVAGTGHDQAVITIALLAPAPSLAAVAVVGAALDAALFAPAPLLASVSYAPAIITMGLIAPAPRLIITLPTGTVSTAALLAPAPTLVITGHSANFITAALVAPAPYLLADVENEILAAFRTWVLNTRKGALTEYGPEFAFNSFAQFNGQVLACGEGGVVVLGLQSADGAAAITGRIRTGKESFESSLHKRVPRIYTSGEFGGEMLFRTITVEGGQRTYSLPFNGISALQQRRVPVGKGPKSRFWQFEMENVDGADFNANDIMVYPIVLRRRVQ